METHLSSDLNYPNLEGKLAFAERLLQGVAEATRSLLTIRNYRESIQSALAILGKATQVDRAYVFRFHYHPITRSPLVSQKWEWVKSGIPEEIENPDLQNLPFADLFPRWLFNLSEGRSISGMVDTFPESEQLILHPQNIISIVVVPIMIQDDFWGFIGFDDCQNGHDWTNSEVAVLQAIAHSFGGAIARYQAEEKLHKANATLTAQAHELLKAKNAANQASRAKSMFLANMSHELRTPLNGILGYTQILKRAIQQDTNESRGVNVIHQSATHLLTLINDILDFSKLEVEQLVLTPSSLDLSLFVHEIADSFQIQANTKKIALVRHISSELPKKVLVDVRRLRQVLLNLLSNAIRFTDVGQVTLSVTLEQENIDLDALSGNQSVAIIQFAISDTGVGISSKDTQRIFNAFEQVGELSRKADGTGLGLNISQRILSAMKSSIQVESTLGQGSTFTFQLKLPVVEANNSLMSPVDSQNDMDLSQDPLGGDAPDPVLNMTQDEIPPTHVLNRCWELVQSGRLKKLVQYLNSLETPTPHASQPVQMMIDLATSFKLDELEELLGKYLNLSCE